MHAAALYARPRTSQRFQKPENAIPFAWQSNSLSHPARVQSVLLAILYYNNKIQPVKKSDFPTKKKHTRDPADGHDHTTTPHKKAGEREGPAEPRVAMRGAP